MSTDAPAFYGWTPNPEGVAAIRAAYPHAPLLAQAAPQLLGAGQDQDITPWRLVPALELSSDDGHVWKAKGKELPYKGQTGNNCTASLARGVDMLQIVHIAAQLQAKIAAGEVDPNDPQTLRWVFHRTCIEFTYAAGLAKAGMRGDNGCYGTAVCEGATDTGLVTYKETGAPYDEDHSRLLTFARNPKGAVAQYGTAATPFRLGKRVGVSTLEEARAALAAGMFLEVCSNVGYNTPRDAKGFCRRRGHWAHNMIAYGSIVSDGDKSIVLGQSWGPGLCSMSYQPELLAGPQPFDLPSYMFRVADADFEAQLAAGDTTAFGLFPGFERGEPLPTHWSWADLLG
jgi:hypothetical protein